eukprot:2736346-Alexandrium_andersonii.AAC.1
MLGERVGGDVGRESFEQVRADAQGRGLGRATSGAGKDTCGDLKGWREGARIRVVPGAMGWHVDSEGAGRNGSRLQR